MFHKQATVPQAVAPVATQPPKPIIKPDLRIVGVVAMVNAQARFAVLTFPSGSVPEANRPLIAYRDGVKMGQLKVTGPQRENDTVADIISGDIQVHDEVRTE